MPLSKFPKTFGLTELHEGYFPHHFNTPENQNKDLTRFQVSNIMVISL
jgi:hypothetical protein